MQRVTNCIYIKDNQVLLLQKPRRNWWVAPGGKMEQGESVREAVVREFCEETGILLDHPSLRGVFTFIIKDGDDIVSEWMMFTFISFKGSGDLLQHSEEGILSWHSLDLINNLPMADGDYHILNHVIRENGMIYGNFTYTPEFKLISYRLDPS